MPGESTKPHQKKMPSEIRAATKFYRHKNSSVWLLSNKENIPPPSCFSQLKDSASTSCVYNLLSTWLLALTSCECVCSHPLQATRDIVSQFLVWGEASLEGRWCHRPAFLRKKSSKKLHKRYLYYITIDALQPIKIPIRTNKVCLDIAGIIQQWLFNNFL